MLLASQSKLLQQENHFEDNQFRIYSISFHPYPPKVRTEREWLPACILDFIFYLGLTPKYLPSRTLMDAAALSAIFFKGPVAWLPLQNKVLYSVV